ELRGEGIRASQRFLDPFFPSEVQQRVIDELGAAADQDAHSEAEVARTLVRAYPAVSNEARESIFQQLVQRPARIEPLLAAVEEGAIAPNDLGPHRRFRLEHHPDAAIAARAKALLGSGERKEADALIAELLPVVGQPGDPANGRMLFRQNCANCHTVRVGGRVEGFAVGPDLTGMGAHGAAALLPFVIDPNRSVEATYLEYVIDTVDGRMLSGVVVRETADRVVLRSSAREDQVMRDEIESMRSTGRTPMPEGFEDLGAEALRDILAFLSSGFEDYRVVDIEPLCTSSTNALYDRARDAKQMRFRSSGVIDVDGVPFELLDAGRLESNALTLMGGMVEGWESKSYPQRVEVPVGFALQRLHVLGGIAAWGFPYTQSRQPIVKLTWRYADGKEEESILTDGEEFADWIRRHDVPGSVFVDLLEDGSWGQVRHFTLDPGRSDVVVESLVLESFDNHLAPTFLALTAQISGAEDQPPVPPPRELAPGTDILIVGGGTSHDYHAWFERVDGTTLTDLGRVTYTELPGDIKPLLDELRVLYLCNNQPLSDPGLRQALLDFVDGGGALLLVHAAIWYNWSDWPEYNAELVGGGSRSHEAYGEFEVRIDDADHPITAGVPATFRVRDELYRFERDAAGSPIRVLATGRSLSSGEEQAVVWTVERGRGRIACITLGHDGAAHTHAAYKALLGNAVSWLLDS
ncbi:MAG: ThuA domain-containing protein, partial [Planctomycetota bacterium]|nr:ThuA domain-containing protein [Planctomycetota bacterium]